MHPSVFFFFSDTSVGTPLKFLFESNHKNNNDNNNNNNNNNCNDRNFVTTILPDVTLCMRKIDWCKRRACNQIGFFGKE